MAKTYSTLSALFTDIADAIREKTRETASCCRKSSLPTLMNSP